MWLRAMVSAAAFTAGGLAAAYAAGPPLAGALAGSIPTRSRPVALAPGDPGVAGVGALAWRGGVAIDSRDRRLGGLSDLRFEAACGRFLAVADTGAWVVLVPDERDGRLVGAAVTWFAPIQDRAGRAPARKADADAEALVSLADGRTMVWFEQDHRAQIYRGVSACRPNSLDAPAEAVLRVPETRGWPGNGGVEAAAPWRDGQIILSEAQPGQAGGREALLLDAGGRVVRRLSIPVPAGFAPTAMAVLEPGSADGPWLLLLRRFSPARGAAAVVALLTVPSDGEPRVTELARLAPPLTVDNMEGIAIARVAGRQMIYLLSDDNFNPAQRTLLMKFELDERALAGL